ncbi:MAG TPA: universal stress protein [Cyclobacteriaceae bacterium]|nr:universal stress protein [Cyclobacteriaceae bacterium]HRK54751.1 universal stress protein [Cyclobacteriaceae bacterium]
MKSILIPVDFSEYANSAINTGIFLAKKTGAELLLLHVFSAPPDWYRIPVEKQQEYPENEARMVEAEIKMDKVIKDKIFKGVKATGVVRPGNVLEEVLAMAKLYKCDLIIMGAHGAGASQRYFIGSTAQKILRTSPCPVLSVKKDFKPASMKKVVFAADFEENLKQPFNKILQFLKATGASLTLLYINTPSNFKDTPTVTKAMTKMMEAYPDMKMKGEVYNALDIEKGLLDYAEQNKIQVIAKVTQNRSRRAGYDFGITETLLFKSNVPLLSVMTN